MISREGGGKEGTSSKGVSACGWCGTTQVERQTEERTTDVEGGDGTRHAMAHAHI